MDIEAIRGARAQSTTIDLWGTPLAVRYTPQRMTQKLVRQLKEVARVDTEGEPSLDDATESVDVLISTVLATVVSWDLASGGQPIPLTIEGLEEVDLDILSEIIRQLREKQVPNDLSGMPTNAPS